MHTLAVARLMPLNEASTDPLLNLRAIVCCLQHG